MSEREDFLEDKLRNTVTLILRLCRCLPETHNVREKALDYLQRSRLMPPPTRDTPAHLKLASDETLKCLERLTLSTQRLLVESPEAMEACIRAVEAEAHFRNSTHDCSCDADCDWCTENCEEPEKAMVKAIDLLLRKAGT